jgi:DNA ligase (NAD+)
MTQQFSVSSFEDHEEEIKALEKLGFAINPLNKRVDSIEEAWRYAQEINLNKDSLAYQIDGVVVKLKNNSLASALDVVGKTPRGWAAIKFKGEEVTTIVLDITWQVGRTGKLTPVVDLEPVELMGTTVKRATLHNVKEVLDTDIRIGDRVIIHKAGDIIPEVLSIFLNLRPVDSKKPIIPTHCPSCNTELSKTETEVDLICTNQLCPQQVIAKLSYYCQRNVANINGLSEKNIEKFVELFGIEDIADLYNLPLDQIFELEGYGQKSIENLKQSIEESKQISVIRFFTGLGIDGVGPEVASLIISSIPKLQNQSESQPINQVLL